MRTDPYEVPGILVLRYVSPFCYANTGSGRAAIWGAPLEKHFVGGDNGSRAERLANRRRRSMTLVPIVENSDPVIGVGKHPIHDVRRFGTPWM